MVNWKSPEESEAWWVELQELKKRVAWLEQRLVDTARRAYGSWMLTVVAMTPPAKQKYISERAQHYAKLIDESKDESEISNHLGQFVKEIMTYSKSG